MNVPIRIYSLSIAVLLLFSVSNSSYADQTDPLLNSLFKKLYQTNSIRQAKIIEFEIMRIWNLSDDKDINRRMNLSDAAMRSRSLDKALNIVTTITREKPNFSEGWNLQATILFFMERYDESIKSVEKTLSLEPRHFGALIGKADMLARKGRLKESRSVLQRVIEIYPLHIRVNKRLEHVNHLIKIRADSYV